MLKLGNVPAAELTFEKKDTLSYYCLVMQEDDGLYEFEGAALPQRFAKTAAEFASSAKSFKRIDRVDDHVKTAQVSQMDEQERFLQAQIDKLPPGWSHQRTKRYMFFFDADKGFVQELEDRIEGMRDQYEKDYPPDHPDHERPPSCASAAARRSTTATAGRRVRAATGTTSRANSSCSTSVRARRPSRRSTTRPFHQYIFYFYGKLDPHPWYNEGTGDFLRGRTADQVEPHHQFRRSARQHPAPRVHQGSRAPAGRGARTRPQGPRRRPRS